MTPRTFAARPMRPVPILLLAALASPTPGLSGERSDRSERPPDAYVELYRKILAADPAPEAPSPHRTVALGEAALRLGLRTGDPAYRRRAIGLFESFLAGPASSLSDFHVLQGFGRFAARLRRESLIPPGLAPKVRQIAEDQLATFLRSSDDSDNNIRLAQMLGYRCLLDVLGDAPSAVRGPAGRRLDGYWSLLVRTGDLDEDATNYDSLGAAFLIDLARAMGREEDLRRSPGFRRMFGRFRDLVSPSGRMAEYGDSYFSESASLDRLYLLEYAAVLYDDPTFLDAARRLRERSGPSLPALDSWYRALPLIDLELSRAEPRPPTGEPSLVTSRSRRGGDRDFDDKLILRTGRGPADAMILLDLYASGSHAHPEKGPSVAYYEADSVPLFHNLGRHATRSAITGNLAWAMPRDEGFPGCWNREKTWFTMRIPVERLATSGDRFVIAPTMTLRNFPERDRSCRGLAFDNLRLEGPSGVRLVDDFDDPSRWDRRLLSKVEVRTSEDRTQGSFSEVVPWDRVPSGSFDRHLTRRPEAPFGRDQYDVLKLDLMYTGSRPYLHVRNLGQQIDLGDQLLAAEVGEARAEQRGRDAYGRVRYRSYIEPGTTLTRHLLLTAEGALFLHDVLVPGPALAGWEAGQLWQLYELEAKGPDWVCASDDGPYPSGAGTTTRRMLVRFDPAANTRVGVEEVRQDYHCPNPKGRRPDRFFTTFSRRDVTPGRPEPFSLVVLPHDPGEGPPPSVADRLAFRPGPDGSTTALIRLENGRGAVEATIGPSGWSVTRRP